MLHINIGATARCIEFCYAKSVDNIYDLGVPQFYTLTHNVTSFRGDPENILFGAHSGPPNDPAPATPFAMQTKQDVAEFTVHIFHYIFLFIDMLS